MGIGIAELYRLFEQPRLSARPLRLLDIGSQNLHGADQETILSFVRKHNDVWRNDDLEAYAELLSNHNAEYSLDNRRKAHAAIYDGTTLGWCRPDIERTDRGTCFSLSALFEIQRQIERRRRMRQRPY